MSVILHMNIPIDMENLTNYCLHFISCDGKQQKERLPTKVLKNVCCPSERIGKCSFDSVWHSECVNYLYFLLIISGLNAYN